MAFNITAKFAKVWKVEVRDRMVLVDLSVSRKNKDGDYVSSKYFKVKFVGKCVDDAKRLQEGDKINILSGLIGKREHEKKWYDDVTVFEFEWAESKGGNGGFTHVDDDSDDLPWT